MVSEMSVRAKATQCLGRQVPEKAHSRWPGRRFRWREEHESGKVIRPGSGAAPAASVMSERMYRSRETVKAWLESSPTSVLEDLDDESSSPSPLESFDSSPTGSIEHLSFTSRFPNAASAVHPPGHARSRTISPPRSANKNSVDLSRIDPAHYSSGSFLVLAFKNAQHRGTSSPPVFQYMSGVAEDDHVQSPTGEEYGSPRSEFSLTSEWQNVLVAGNAAGTSTRGSSGTNSELETAGETLNISDLELDSDASDPHANPQVVRMPHRRTRSMDLPSMYDRSASGELKDASGDDDGALAELARRQTGAGTILEQDPVRRLSKRNSLSFNSVRETLGEVEKRKEQAQGAELISRHGREEKEINSWGYDQRETATSTMKQAEENDIAMARRKKKATVEAKQAENAGRAVVEAKLVNKRTGRHPRGCLFLV